MKMHSAAALMGLSATAVSAQYYNQTGPWALHIKGTNADSTIDGYGNSCHAGAAIEGLCYGAGDISSTSEEYEQYYFNYTSNEGTGQPEIGFLTWNLPFIDGSNETRYESEAMGLTYQINSNVAAVMFGYGTQMNVGFDEDDKLYGWTYVDDADFVPGTFPNVTAAGTMYYQWQVCYQYFTGYYYQSVGWVQSTPAHNPTCEPVEITRVTPAA